MLNVGHGTKIFLVTGATDMRKSYDTLAAIVSNTLEEDPYSGNLFAFANRGRNRVKLLLWSMPPRRSTSSSGVMSIDFSDEPGHANVPFSNRFAKSQNPD